MLLSLRASCGGEGNVAVAVSSPMVLAVCGVGFDGELEAFGVFGLDGFGDFPVGGAFEFEDVGFPAHAPRPEAVAVTVRDQRELVKVA